MKKKNDEKVEVSGKRTATNIPNDLMVSLSKGTYPDTTISIPNVGEFVMKFPTGRDEMAVARMTSKYLGGLPRESFTPGMLMAVERDCTLIVCIDEYPEDFGEYWKKEGFFDYPKVEVKNALYKAFSTFLDEVQERIS